MSHSIRIAAALAAAGALAMSATPTFASVSYDFSSVPQDTTVTPYTLQGATFSSSDGDPGGFTFGANGGEYSQLASNVLSSAGYPAILDISFAQAQSGINFAYAIGDEYLKNKSGAYVGNGSDQLLVTTNTGYSTTINLAAPTTGTAFAYPQSNFSLSGASPFTSVAIEALDSTGEESLAISTLSTTPVPLPASAWLLGGGLAALGFARRKTVRTA